eukprot:Gb_18433 [translate_table: standard]
MQGGDMCSQGGRTSCHAINKARYGCCMDFIAYACPFSYGDNIRDRDLELEGRQFCVRCFCNMGLPLSPHCEDNAYQEEEVVGASCEHSFSSARIAAQKTGMHSYKFILQHDTHEEKGVSPFLENVKQSLARLSLEDMPSGSEGSNVNPIEETCEGGARTEGEIPARALFDKRKDEVGFGTTSGLHCVANKKETTEVDHFTTPPPTTQHKRRLVLFDNEGNRRAPAQFGTKDIFTYRRTANQYGGFDKFVQIYWTYTDLATRTIFSLGALDSKQELDTLLGELLENEEAFGHAQGLVGVSDQWKAWVQLLQIKVRWVHVAKQDLAALIVRKESRTLKKQSGRKGFEPSLSLPFNNLWCESSFIPVAPSLFVGLSTSNVSLSLSSTLKNLHKWGVVLFTFWCTTIVTYSIPATLGIVSILFFYYGHSCNFYHCFPTPIDYFVPYLYNSGPEHCPNLGFHDHGYANILKSSSVQSPAPSEPGSYISAESESASANQFQSQ